MRSESGNSHYSELKAKWEQMAKKSEDSGPSKSSQQSPPSSEINGEYPVGEGKGANRTGSVIASRGPFRTVRRQKENKPDNSSIKKEEKIQKIFRHPNLRLSAATRRVLPKMRNGPKRSHPPSPKVKKGSKPLALFIKQVPDVNRREEKWMQGTALHQVAKERSPLGFVKVLADCGIDFNIQHEWGNTALLWAIANGNNEMAMEILKHDQDLNLQDLGNSALKVTIAKGYKKNKMGLTPLHLACIRRDPGMIKALLENGADLSSKDLMGKHTGSS